MLLKVMNAHSDLSDSNPGKGFKIVDNVIEARYFHHDTGEAAIRVVYSSPNKGLIDELFTLGSNAYLMNSDGKTIETFSPTRKVFHIKVDGEISPKDLETLVDDFKNTPESSNSTRDVAEKHLQSIKKFKPLIQDIISLLPKAQNFEHFCSDEKFVALNEPRLDTDTHRTEQSLKVVYDLYMFLNSTVESDIDYPTITFFADDYNDAKTLFEFFKQIIDTSPWFKAFHQLLNNFKQADINLYDAMPNALFYYYLGLRVDVHKFSKANIRGKSHIAAVLTGNYSREIESAILKTLQSTKEVKSNFVNELFPEGNMYIV